MTFCQISTSTPQAVRKAYSIEGELPISYFRVRESSASTWTAEGYDLWGGKVLGSGGDPDAQIDACVNDAKAIVSEKASKRTESLGPGL